MKISTLDLIGGVCLVINMVISAIKGDLHAFLGWFCAFCYFLQTLIED